MSGILAMQHQKFREAVEAFGKSLRYGGDDRKCRMGLAMALFGQGLPRPSQKVLLEVLGDHPDDEEALHWLIRACTAVEDWDELERSLSCYLQRNPANIDVRFTLASVQVRRENTGEAQSQLEMLQLLNPDYDGLQDLKFAIERMHVDPKVVGAL
jgi:thioredoxin-like negative regulator of GroEL